MCALLEVQNSEQDANFVWLWDRALGEAGNEESAVLMNVKPYMEEREKRLAMRGQKDGGKLMRVGTAWGNMRGESWERAKELVESARGVYHGAEFGAHFGEATAKGWREVRDGSEAWRKPN